LSKKQWGVLPLPSLFPFLSPSPSFPFFPPPSSSLFSPFSPPSLPLEVGPLKSSYGVWVSAVSSPSEVWGGGPAEIEFGAF